MGRFNDIVQRFDYHLVEGDLTMAMVTSLDVFSKIDPEEESSGIFHLPSIIWKPIFRVILDADEKNVEDDGVSLKELMPTLKFDVQLVNETQGKLENFKNVPAQVYYSMEVRAPYS